MSTETLTQPSHRSFKTIGRIGAALLPAVVAVTGCAPGPNAEVDTAAFCSGSKAVAVENNDTLTGLLVENTNGVTTSGEAKLAAIAVGQAWKEQGNSEKTLPKRVDVYKYEDGTLAPTLIAGETVSIPEECFFPSVPIA